MSYHYHHGPIAITTDTLLHLPPATTKSTAPPLRRATVSQGRTPSQLANSRQIGPLVQLADNRLLFSLPSGTTVLLEDGHTITYSLGEGSPIEELRLYLMGSVWGALCYQNGLLPLHCSSVISNCRYKGAIAFTGPSGAGKSTLSAGLSLREGFQHFSDDILVVDPAPQIPTAYPELKNSKLWQDTCEMLELQPTGSVLPHTPDYDKCYVDISHKPSDPVKLSAIYLISRTELDSPEADCKLQSLSGAARFQAVLGSLYRPRFADALLPRATLFEQISRLAHQVDVFRFQRPNALSRLQDTLEAVRAHQLATPMS